MTDEFGDTPGVPEVSNSTETEVHAELLVSHSNKFVWIRVTCRGFKQLKEFVGFAELERRSAHQLAPKSIPRSTR